MLVDFISANSKLYWLDFYINLHEFKSDVDKLKYIFHPREGNRRWFASIPLSPSPSFRPLTQSKWAFMSGGYESFPRHGNHQRGGGGVRFQFGSL